MRKKTLKEKFVLSFFLITIPLILFLSFFCVYDYHLSARNLRQAESLKFEEASNKLEFHISKIDKLLENLSMTSAVRYTENGLDRASASSVYMILSNLDSAISYSDDIILALYMQGSDKIYIENKTLPYRYLEECIQSVDFNMSKVFSKLNTATIPTRFRLVNKEGTDAPDYVARIYPISFWSGASKDSVLIITPAEKLLSVYEDIIGELKGNLYIFNGAGDAIVSDINDGSIPELAQFPPIKGSGCIEATVNGKDLVIFRDTSKSNDITSLYVLDRDVFYSGIERHSTLVIGVILIAISLITGLAVFLVQYNYRPIKNIIDEFIPETGANINELDIIRNIIESSSKDKADMDMMKDRFLLDIVQGHVVDSDNMAGRAQKLGINLEHSFFFAAIAAFAEDEEKRRFIDKCNAFVNRDDGDVFIHFLVSGMDGTPLFLIGFDSLPLEVDGTRRKLVSDIIERTTDGDDFKLCWGVGNVYTSVSSLRSSSLEARATARLANWKEGDNLFYYDDSETKGNMQLASLPILEQNFLLESLKMGELGMAEVALDNIITQITRSSNSQIIAQMLCYDVLNILFQFIHNSNISMNDLDFMKKEPFQAVEGFRHTAHHLIREICSAIEKKASDDVLSQEKNVQEYITAEYTSTMLSNDSAAEALGISKAKLNDICRNLYGCTFSQKIVQMRMEEVKRLLRETDDKISSIITSVGYSDVPNFVRKFRQTTGMTPSQYRELNK